MPDQGASRSKLSRMDRQAAGAVFRRWVGPVVSFLLGWAYNLTGPKNPLIAQVLLAIAALWSFAAFVTLESVRRLSWRAKGVVWSAAALVLCFLWWGAAYHIFVPPPEIIPEQLAEAAAEAALRKQAAAQPLFAFVLRSCAHDRTVDCLEIWNRGERIRSFTVQQYAFVRVTGRDYPASRVIPTLYYQEQRPTGKLAGKLTTLVGAPPSGGSLRTLDLLDSQMTKKYGEWNSVVDIRLFIEMKYIDTAGSSRSSGYEILLRNRFDPIRILDYDVGRYGHFTQEEERIEQLSVDSIEKNWDRYRSSDEVFPSLFRGE